MLETMKWDKPQGYTVADMKKAKDYIEGVLVLAQDVGYDNAWVAVDSKHKSVCCRCRCPIPVDHYAIYPEEINDMQTSTGDDPVLFEQDVCFECFVDSDEVPITPPPNGLVRLFMDRGEN